MRTISKLTLVAGSLAAVLGMNAVVAQEQRPQQPQTGMMQGEGMMPMMGMMQQMSQMMETCNKRMQAHMSRPAPTTPPAQPQNQQ